MDWKKKAKTSWDIKKNSPEYKLKSKKSRYELGNRNSEEATIKELKKKLGWDILNDPDITVKRVEGYIIIDNFLKIRWLPARKHLREFKYFDATTICRCGNWKEEVFVSNWEDMGEVIANPLDCFRCKFERAYKEVIKERRIK